MSTRSTYINFSTWERGHKFTREELLCLYESDFLVKFAIDGMIDDLSSNWLKNFKEPNPEAPIAPKAVNAMKWGDLYGDTIVVLLDAATDDGQITDVSLLKNPFSGTAAGLDVFHPLVDNDGYEDPKPVDLDSLGNPKVFRVHIRGVKEIVEIDASRVVVFPGRMTRRSWRGICEFAASIDDIVDYRKWRATYGSRAADVGIPNRHANKADPNAEWTDDEKKGLKSAYGQDKVFTTTGTVTITPTASTITPGELDSTATALLNAFADDIGVTLNDVFQKFGGAEKFAPDSNQSTYFIALRSRGKRHELPLTKVLKAFGIKWEGWNSPWEESLQSKVTNMNTLATAYENTNDPEIKAIIKAMYVSQYGEKTDYEKYLATERANAARNAANTAAFLGRKGGAFSNSSA